MKKAYGKPLVSVEVMSLDMAVATNDCNLSNTDRKALKDLGCFLPDSSCSVQLVMETGGFDYNGDGVKDPLGASFDTVCYHSNVTTVFVS